MQPSAVRRLTVPALLALAVLLFTAGPAAAHVEATVSDGAQAGGGPITVTFSAEAERSAAGIAGVKTQLPAGILPEWVSLVSGPDGWALTGTADGYSITGPALAPGTDAEYAIRIGTVPPDSTTLVFKTLVDYTDGSEDAWIEEPTSADPDPESPAPAVSVAPAAATASAPATSAAPTSAAPASATPSPAAAEDSSSGPGAALYVTIGLVVLLAVAGALWFWRSRRGAQ
jgi:hypothetical protein